MEIVVVFIVFNAFSPFKAVNFYSIKIIKYRVDRDEIILRFLALQNISLVYIVHDNIYTHLTSDLHPFYYGCYVHFTVYTKAKRLVKYIHLYFFILHGRLKY